MQIESNIPVPNPGTGGNRKYPWRDMEVGDSFRVEPREGQTPRPPSNGNGSSGGSNEL